MKCFQNAQAYFVTAVSYARKMFMKLAPDRDFNRFSLGVEGEQVRAGVDRRGQEHQQTQLFPHPHPAVKPVEKIIKPFFVFAT
jgi:hypothetical protein